MLCDIKNPLNFDKKIEADTLQLVSAVAYNRPTRRNLNNCETIKTYNYIMKKSRASIN